MNFDVAEFIAALTSGALWDGARATLVLAVVSWTISLVVAVPLALGKTSRLRYVASPVATWVWLFRGVPLLVLLIFVYNALPELVPALRGPLEDPFVAGLLALVLSESAYMAEALRSGLLAVHSEQRDAGRALGLTPLALQRLVVLPIAVRVAVPSLGNEFVSNLKNTSLVSVISLVELTLAGQRLYTRNFAVLETMSAVALLYLVAVTGFSLLQRRIERDLGKHTSAQPPARLDVVPAEAVNAPVDAADRAVRCGKGSVRGGETVIEVRGLTKSFGGDPVLREVDLDVHSGEVCVVLGRSGSGKSTLLRCLNRLEQPDSGTVRLNGTPFGYRESDGRPGRPLGERHVAPIRRDLGMVFQRFNLFPHMTAAENVALGPRHHGLVDRRAAVDYVMPYLSRVGMDAHAHKYPSQLSGGQQQRVAIARALALRPDAILLDEPTSALDPELVDEVLRVIQDLSDEGRTMVIVTHEIRFARLVADTVVFMEDGRIAEVSEASKFFDEPESPGARRFVLTGRTS